MFYPNEVAELVVVRRSADDRSSYSRGVPSKFHVGTGNGRQYKQTVSFGEFRKRLYRRSGATACNATLLDLERSSVYWCDEDTRLQAYTWLRIAHTLFLTVSPSHMHTKATIYWRPLRYLSVECHTPSFHSSPPLVIDVFARAFELANVNLTLGITVESFAEEASRRSRETLLDFRQSSRFSLLIFRCRFRFEYSGFHYEVRGACVRRSRE